jgi:uncharacterized repeat protein (TIGR01451 family)
MKRVTRLFNSLPKRLFAISLFGLAIALPVANSMAADTVRMEGSLGVGNVTAGDTTYKHEVNASYDQVVKFQVFYHNQENPDSGKIAQNVRVKVAIPTTSGQTQVVRSTTSADNANTVQDQATVHLDRADAYLEYIPGSAIWKHNTGSNESPVWTEQKISDEVVYGNGGVVVENEKPCFNYAATVTVLARVRIPGVSVVKTVRVKGTTNWTTENTAKPGETLQYQIAYKNTGNTEQKAVAIQDNLPPMLQYVPGSTMLKNDSGTRTVADGVTTGGLGVGDYGPGAAAYVLLEVKVPAEDKLQCGVTEFRNVGAARPQGMNYFYNTTITRVEKKCQPNQPKYSCDLLDITKGSDRKVTISKFTTTAQNGATFKDAVINWGDNTAPLTTNTVVGQNHTYAKDGTYTVSATARFEVNGQIVTASSADCAKSVSFTTPPTPPTPPVTPTTPSELPNTGAGDVLGIFAAVTIAGAVAHRLFLGRRFSR